MSSSASRERASSLAALSSDVAAGAPATASPKNGRRSVMGVPRVTKIPSFRRSSSGKMSKRRDVPAGELAGPSRKAGATYAPEELEPAQPAAAAAAPRKPAPRLKPAALDGPLEDHPEHSFWEESLENGARSTDTFFDGTATYNRRRFDSAERVDRLEAKRRSGAGTPPSVLGPLGYFCACAPTDENVDERPGYICAPPTGGDRRAYD